MSSETGSPKQRDALGERDVEGECVRVSDHDRLGFGRDEVVLLQRLVQARGAVVPSGLSLDARDLLICPVVSERLRASLRTVGASAPPSSR